MTKEGKENQITDTRQSILEAASKLITEKGVKNTSLADIAKEVGISKGTLYYYYSTKDDIIYDITDIHLRQITEELLCWIGTIENDATPEEILVIVFEKILKAETRGKLHLYLISDAAIGNNSLKERFKQRYREWRNTLEDGTRMVLKDKKVNYEMLSHIILAVLDGFTIQQMIGVEQIPIKDIANILASVE